MLVYVYSPQLNVGVHGPPQVPVHCTCVSAVNPTIKQSPDFVPHFGPCYIRERQSVLVAGARCSGVRPPRWVNNARITHRF
jgi:hypothetical protein